MVVFKVSVWRIKADELTKTNHFGILLQPSSELFIINLSIPEIKNAKQIQANLLFSEYFIHKIPKIKYAK